MTDSAVSEELTLDLPRAIYSAEALKRAAYALMDRVDVEISDTPDGIRCILRPLTDGADPATLMRDFRRELLDQELRLSIEAQTAPIRDAIIGLAFSRTGLQG